MQFLRDLIFSGCFMPHGYCCSWTPGQMADRRIKSIPVIVLTSSAEECDLLATYDLGANSYIQKPVDFDEFRETANALVQYWCQMNLAPARERATRTEKSE